MISNQRKDMLRELHFLTEVISSIIYNKTVPQEPEDLNWEDFARLVLENGLSGIVYEAIKEVTGIPENLKVILQKKHYKGVYRSISQDYYVKKLLAKFEKEEVKCLPLKGIILRELYPAYHMRSMSDLDILIDPDKLNQTREIMQTLGFEVVRYDSHHDIYHIKPSINVELHKLLIVGEMEDYFQIGFERAHLREGSEYIYEMSKEDFYIHMLGHMAYHFAHGGVGIRLVLDIHVYLDHYKDVLDREYLKQELDKVGLYTFADYMEKLAAIWFAGEKSNAFYDELGEYIVKSGYLGSQKHKEILEVVKQAGSKAKKGVRTRAVLSAIFLPYKSMAFLYPILKKCPFLLPFAWVARWIKILKERRQDIFKLQRLSQTDDKDIQQIGELYDKLEMRHLL